jgi:hypothetical protein
METTMSITINVKINRDDAETHYYIKPSYRSWGVYRDDIELAATATVGYTKHCRTDAAYIRAAFDLVAKDIERQRPALAPTMLPGKA